MSLISTFVLNTLTLKEIAFFFQFHTGISRKNFKPKRNLSRMNVGLWMFSRKKIIFMTIPMLPFIVNGWIREVT